MYCYAPACGILLVGYTLVLAADEGQNRGDYYLKKAGEARISPLQRTAYEELSKVHAVSFFTLGVPPPNAFAYNTRQSGGYWGWESGDHPMAVLYRMGLDVLPTLVEALGDETPSQDEWRSPCSLGPKAPPARAMKVNELIAMLICRIAERTFAVRHGEHIGDYIYCVGSKPDLVPEFRKQVLVWYRDNHGKTLAQRKIDDVNSDIAINRNAAVAWIGEHKERAGQAVIARYAEDLYMKQRARSAGVNPYDHEISGCALTLGQLGDPGSLELVRRICKLVGSRDAMWFANGIERDSLFDAYHGLASLGEKDESLRDLEQVFENCAPKLSERDQKQFQERLDAAQKW
jgi:hypothetical protein